MPFVLLWYGHSAFGFHVRFSSSHPDELCVVFFFLSFFLLFHYYLLCVCVCVCAFNAKEKANGLSLCPPFELDSVSKIMIIFRVIDMIFAASFISLSIQIIKLKWPHRRFRSITHQGSTNQRIFPFLSRNFLEHSFSIALSPRPSVIQKWLFSFNLFSFFFSFFLSVIRSLVHLCRFVFKFL